MLFGLKRITEGAEGEDGKSEAPEPDRGTYQAVGIGLDTALAKDKVGPIRHQLASIKEKLEALCENILKAEPDRGEIDRQVHEIQTIISNARRSLRNSQEIITPAVKDSLGAQFLILKEMTKDVLETLDNPDVNSDEVDTRVAKLEDLTRNLETIYEDWRPQKFRRWSAPPAPLPGTQLSERLPWSLIFAVSLDSFVDGFLIGLAYVASSRAGLIMAAATCIEMGFLGLTYSATLRGVTRFYRKQIPLVLVPPCLIVLGGAIGAALGDVATSSPGLFVGFVAFSIVALLFLVTQELIIEAHENQDGAEIWWINIWLFIGILVVIVVEKVTEQ